MYRFIFLILLVIGAPVATATATAADLVVDAQSPLASDQNPGSADKPLKTIKKAAELANAGDRVLVKPGVYVESIVISKSGTKEKPIVFQSEKPWAAVISGGEHVKEYTLNEYPYLFGCPRRNPKNGELWDGAEWITLRGFTFKNGVGGAVGAGTGWHVEDCLIEGANLDGIVPRGADIVIERCVVQDVGNNGMAGIACTNLLVKDCIVRRSNRHGFSPGGFAGACKFLMNNNARFENIVSYDNFGCGWWLDWDNSDYVITGCTIFGNHAGKATENNKIVDHWWSAAGIWLEGNHGKGLISNNVIYSNVCSGIGVLETQNVTIENNIIADCGTGVEYRDLTREEKTPVEKQVHRLNNIVVRNNKFKAIRGMAHLSSIGDWQKGKLPGNYGLSIDGNTYDLKPGNEVIHFLEASAKTIEEARSMTQIEPTGVFAPVDLKEKFIPTVSTDEKEFYSKEKTRFRQVPSDDAEKIAIDDALSGHSAGDTVEIAVFGRTPLIAKNDAWTCDVYDLAHGRHVRLTLRDEKLKSLIENAVTPYTRLEPTTLSIKLIAISPYSIDAEPVSAANAIVRVACVGDSITVGGGLANRDRDNYPAVLGRLLGDGYQVCNFGANGAAAIHNADISYWKLNPMAEATKFNPNIVVIALGTNDLRAENWGHKNEFEKDLSEMIRHFQNLPARPAVFVCLPVPMYTGAAALQDELLPMVRKAAEKCGVPLIDLFTPLSGKADWFADKIHPNADGAAEIAKTVRAAITAAAKNR